MAALAGARARYWFGKRVRSAPGSEAGTDAEGRDGKVSLTHRWFSYEWWLGHHMQRATDGTWSSWSGRGKAPAGAKWAKTSHGARSRPNYLARRASNHAAYRDYLAEREEAAVKATNGYMVTKAGKARGYDEGSFFDPNASRRPGRRFMSDELRSWMGDSDSPQEGKGARGVLSFRRWQQLTQAKKAA